jgi:uncharacterized membrane protein YdjX (TVP38/TMEM64 family)
MSKLPWKWIALGAAVIALVIAARVLPVTQWLREFSEWAGNLGIAGFVAFVFVYAIATVLFVPGWPLTVGAGFAFGLLIGTAAVSVGSTFGAALAFLAGRFIARERIERWSANNKRFQAIDRAIGKEGWKLILLLRLSPVIPFNVSNYFYGITAVKFWPYLFASWVGMVPGTVLYVYLGSIGKAGLGSGSGNASMLKWILLGTGLVATVLVTVWVSRIAKRALESHDV